MAGLTPGKVDDTSDDLIAMSIGDACLRFSDVAEVLRSFNVKDEELKARCESGELSELLDEVAQGLIHVAMGMRAGILDSDEYVARSRIVMRYMLWQDCAERSVTDHAVFEEDEPSQYTILIHPWHWDEVAGNFRFSADVDTAMISDSPLLFYIDGAVVERIRKVVEKQLTEDPKGKLDDFLQFGDLEKDEAVIRWSWGSLSGDSSMVDFIDGYDGVLVRKEAYSSDEIVRLMFEQFLANERFEFARVSGELSQRADALGLDAYRRRFARIRYLQALRASIPPPTESELIDFFELNREKFKLPESIRLMRYVVDTEDMATVGLQMSRVVRQVNSGYPSRRELPESEEVMLTAKQADFYTYLPLKIGDFSKPRQSGDHFEFFRKLGETGESEAKFENVRKIVEQSFREAAYSRKLKEAERAFLENEHVVYHERITSILCSDAFEKLLAQKD